MEARIVEAANLQGWADGYGVASVAHVVGAGAVADVMGVEGVVECVGVTREGVVLNANEEVVRVERDEADAWCGEAVEGVFDGISLSGDHCNQSESDSIVSQGEEWKEPLWLPERVDEDDKPGDDHTAESSHDKHRVDHTALKGADLDQTSDFGGDMMQEQEGDFEATDASCQSHHLAQRRSHPKQRRPRI